MIKSGSEILILMVSALMLTAVACDPDVEASTPSAAGQLEFETLKGQIADPQRTGKTRFEAARLLLGKSDSRANEVLRQFLADSSNPGAQLAVAEAVAVTGGGAKSYIAPLIKMLIGDEPSVRSAAAKALVTYQNPGVTDRVIAIARDRKQNIAVRLVTIEALQRVIAKRYIQTLIDLLADPDPAVRTASAESLARLTNIRTFGARRGQWQAWWKQNRDKSRIEWLTGLADSLTRSKMTLEKENTQLRERLVKAKQDIYDTSSKEQKQDILLELLKDPVSDVRLLGVTMTDRRLAANQEIVPKLCQSVRALLDDEAPRIRQAVAMLEANLAGDGTGKVLLRRLGVEPLPIVRVGLLTALGQLKTPQALPAVLAALRSTNIEEATAAAGALARIVEAAPLAGPQQADAGKVLVARYAQTQVGENAQILREALLRAMGVVGDPSAAKVLAEALKDQAGVIRLAAVNGLASLRASGAAREIAPLVGDSDRGVRQAAITALTSLGGQDFLKIILKRTDPQVEPDPAVRKQALEGVLAHCQTAEAETLEVILKLINNQAKADDLRVRILSLYVAALRRESPKSPEKLSIALRTLGRSLVQVNRVDEAVPVFDELCKLLRADKSPKGRAEAKKAWLEYISAMLAANNPAVAAAMAKEADKTIFAEAVRLFQARIAVLMRKKNSPAAIVLIEAILAEQPNRLTKTQRAELQKKLEEAKK